MKVKLGSLYKISSGGTPLKKNKEYYDNGDINWVKTGDLKQQYLFNTQDCITQIGFEKSSAKMYEENTVLVAMYGATIGATSILKIPACTNQACAAFPIIDKVIPEYLYYFLKSKKKQFVKDGVGGAQPNISMSYLKNVDFILTEVEEQKKIVETLEKTGRLIELKRLQIQELDTLIKSRFVEMFVDKYEKIKVSTKLRTTSGGTPKSDESEYYSNGTIPWLTSSEVNQGRIKKTEKYITEKGLSNSSAKWIPKKSIVIAMYGATAGKVGIIEIPTTTNQAVCAVLPHDEYNPEYLRFAFEYISDELAGKAVGGGQPNISQAIIKDSFIYNPPLVVQRKFSVFVEQVDKLKFVVQKSLDETQKLFDSLMQEYFG